VRHVKHEGAETVATLGPFGADTVHIQRQHVMRHVSGMRQRDHVTLGQQVIEAQVPIPSRQRLAACADDQPADAPCEAMQVHRLHEREFDERIRPRQHRQPRDFGARLHGHAAWQRDAALDQQGPA
jgi:hypothetical protein